jgi:ADP-ribosylglycohydrolase
MIGAIIGDIVGSKYEFNNTFDYNFKLFDEGCNFTDDTICTIAVADAILRKGGNEKPNVGDYCISLQYWRKNLLMFFHNICIIPRAKNMLNYLHGN